MKKVTIDWKAALDFHNANNEKQLTFNDLIDGAEVTRMTLHNWEHGKIPKGFQSVVRIAELTNYPIEKLINYENNLF